MLILLGAGIQDSPGRGCAGRGGVGREGAAGDGGEGAAAAEAEQACGKGGAGREAKGRSEGQLIEMCDGHFAVSHVVSLATIVSSFLHLGRSLLTLQYLAESSEAHIK
jgi:hypothetical protein